MSSAHTIVTAKPILLPSLTAFVKKIARHTKSKSAVLTVELLTTCVCCKKTYVHDVQISPSTILEAAQVMGTILFSFVLFWKLK